MPRCGCAVDVRDKRADKSEGANVGSDFDPRQFRVAAPRGFADLKVGETFRSPSRTVTDAHFSAFQALSGDNHPIHNDV
jgi:acyl dehydratase